MPTGATSKPRGATLLVLGALLSGAASAADVPPYVAAAVASVSRPPQDMALDADRMPAQLLIFSGAKPGDKVLELLPGDGYYTRMLSKLAGPRGEIYPFAPGVMPRRPTGGVLPLPAANRKRAPDPVETVYWLSRSADFANVEPIWGVNSSAYGGYIGLPEQVDVAWAAGIYHKFRAGGFANMAPVAVDGAVFRDLKSGGVFIVEDDASAPNPADSVDPATVKQEAAAAGFVLAGEEQLGGPAGRFVLRFKKPANAPVTDKHHMDRQMGIYWGNTFVSGSTTERAGTIFYHPDHTYQEFNGDRTTNGIWYIDADGNNCMMHQSENAGNVGSVACRPAVIIKQLGEVVEQPVDEGSIPVSLMKGYVYPNITTPNAMPVLPQPAGAPAGGR